MWAVCFKANAIYKPTHNVVTRLCFHCAEYIESENELWTPNSSHSISKRSKEQPLTEQLWWIPHRDEKSTIHGWWKYALSKGTLLLKAVRTLRSVGTSQICFSWPSLSRLFFSSKHELASKMIYAPSIYCQK